MNRAQQLALASIACFVIAMLAFANGLVKAATDATPAAAVSLIIALVLVVASYLLRAGGRRAAGLHPFREDGDEDGS